MSETIQTPPLLLWSLGYDEKAELVSIRLKEDALLVEDGLRSYNPPMQPWNLWLAQDKNAATLLSNLSGQTLCIERSRNTGRLLASDVAKKKLVEQWGEKYLELKATMLFYTPYVPADVPPWLSIDLAANDEFDVRLEKFKEALGNI